MSTHYATLTKVLASELFDGCLNKFGVREEITDETTESDRLLTDGRNYVCVYVNDDGFIDAFVRYARNGAPTKVLNAVAAAFDTDIVSEYEPQYWGFDTEEEWEAWNMDIARKDEDEFYLELLKFLRGEPNDIRPGSIGMCHAEIAKTLVETDLHSCRRQTKASFWNQSTTVTMQSTSFSVRRKLLRQR